MKIFIFLIFFLCLSSVIALNETNVTYADNTGEVWLESNETKEEIPEATCEEQIKLLLDEYNNLTKDYHEGVNCGTITYLLKDNNQILGEKIEDCREDVGKYKVGFFGLIIFLILEIVFLFYKRKSIKFSTP